MVATRDVLFDLNTYLSTSGKGRRHASIKAKTVLFSQGSVADSVFFLNSGRAKLTVVSQQGKEATITLLTDSDFIGVESASETGQMRCATATTITACVALRIERNEIIRALHEEPAFSDFFVGFMLARGIRTQADLVDQLFNSSERRLARILLIMADYGKRGDSESFIPPITQEALAEMIGTTRSRVSFFMNRFRKLGYISYKRRIRVNKTLLDVVLRDLLPADNASRPKVKA